MRAAWLVLCWLARVACLRFRFPAFEFSSSWLGGKQATGLSHRNSVNELAELLPSLSYEGWQRNAKETESTHNGPTDTLAPLMLDAMRRKQQVQDGDRSHPIIRKLDALTPTLSYRGWEKDAREIEWPGCAGVRAELFSDERDAAKSLESMRKKQQAFSGDRSHKNLRNLDELVARLASSMQVPTSSAPRPSSSAAAMLWDAEEIPIDHLMQKIIDGKTCALSCLGLAPHMSHSKEDIRARFRTLARRVHPDKEKHPQATAAFVAVRAAYERLVP